MTSPAGGTAENLELRFLRVTRDEFSALLALSPALQQSALPYAIADLGVVEDPAGVERGVGSWLVREVASVDSSGAVTPGSLLAALAGALAQPSAWVRASYVFPEGADVNLYGACGDNTLVIAARPAATFTIAMIAGTPRAVLPALLTNFLDAGPSRGAVVTSGGDGSARPEVLVCDDMGVWSRGMEAIAPEDKGAVLQEVVSAVVR